MSNKYILGADIGGTTIKLGLFDCDMNLLKKWAIPTIKSHDENKIFYDIKLSVDKTLKNENILKNDVLGLGIGIPGPIINKSELATKCANINLNPCNITEKFDTDYKIIVDNDANLACLGEYISGSGNLCSDIILITVGTGIGAGVISNNRLISGFNGSAGEIGHMKLPLSYLYELSSDDYEELEKIASGIYIVEIAKKFLKLPKYSDSILHNIEINAENIFKNNNDILAEKLINIMAKYIALALSYSASITNPKKFIIGGGVSRSKLLIEKIESYYKYFASRFIKDDVEFVQAKLINDAGIYGAAASILLDNKDDDYFYYISIVGTKNIITNKLGKDVSSFKSGGKIKYYITPDSTDNLIKLISYLEKNKKKYFIVGKGSNILIKDEGYNGVIISLENLPKEIYLEKDMLYISSNHTLKEISKYCIQNALTGFEFADGIPGSLGGAIYMNAGAYGGEMKDVISKVIILDKNTLELKSLSKDELEFEYRNSKVKKNSDIVIGAYIKLNSGNSSEIQSKVNELMEKRKSKQPLEYPSCGSTFKRPKDAFAGELIMNANLKGYTIGGAMVSPKHAGFIINYNNATSNDIICLIRYIQNEVYKKFNVKLEPEVIIIDND